MVILWGLLLISAASAHKVVDSTEDIGPEAFANVTTLYPVANQQTNNITNNDSNKDNITNDSQKNVNENSNIRNTTESSVEKSDSDAKEDNSKGTSWKIQASFAASDLNKDNDNNGMELKNETKEFKPSQPAGEIVEDVVPTKNSYDFFTPVLTKPVSSFANSKENHQKIPKELLRSHHPYKFESNIVTHAKDWRPDRRKPFGTPGLEGLGNKWGSSHSGLGTIERPIKSWSQEFNEENPGNTFEGYGDGKIWGHDLLDPKPTVDVPVKLPAGGLYKYPDPFKEKPGLDENLGLEYNHDIKDYAIKKRNNPWEGILRMLTAFIPIGIIISALTPSIITIENTGPGNAYPTNIYRRAGVAITPETLSEIPTISERCKRRLLCELHNEKNYNDVITTPSSPRNWRHCHRIRCEDPATLATALRWLLHRQTNQHDTDDMRLHLD